MVWGGWSVGWVLVWSGLSRLSVCLPACGLCRGHGSRSERTTLHVDNGSDDDDDDDDDDNNTDTPLHIMFSWLPFLRF